jgi:hypothetical protein
MRPEDAVLERMKRKLLRKEEKEKGLVTDKTTEGWFCGAVW